MLIIAVIAEKESVVQKGRSVGKTLRTRVGIGIDPWNLVLATQVGDNPWHGKSFFLRLSHMEPFLRQLDIEIPNAAMCTQQALEAIFHRTPVKRMSLYELDTEFHTTKSKCDEAQSLQMGSKWLYFQVRDYCRADGEKGDAIVNVQDPIAEPQIGFGVLQEDDPL